MTAASQSAAAPAGIGTLIPRLAPGVRTEAGQDDVGGLRLRSAPLQRGWLGRRLGLAESIAVELDDLGAFVVQRLDGRPLDELAAAVAGHLRLTRREAETCTADFLRQLIDRRLVVVERPADSASRRSAEVAPSGAPPHAAGSSA